MLTRTQAQTAAERQYLIDTAPNRPTETETRTTERTPMTEESKMKKIGKTLKANAGEAAWRVGAAQATRTAKAAVVAGVLKSIPKTEKALRKQIKQGFIAMSEAMQKEAHRRVGRAYIAG